MNCVIWEKLQDIFKVCCLQLQFFYKSEFDFLFTCRYVNTRIKTSTENLPTQPGSVLAIRTDILSNFVEFVQLLYKNRQIWADTAGGDFA